MLLNIRRMLVDEKQAPLLLTGIAVGVLMTSVLMAVTAITCLRWAG